MMKIQGLIQLKTSHIHEDGTVDVLSVPWSIERANIAGAGMMGPKASYSYTGKVTMFGRALVKGTDFAVS